MNLIIIDMIFEIFILYEIIKLIYLEAVLLKFCFRIFKIYCLTGILFSP
jgi:hypothetical protein